MARKKKIDKEMGFRLKKARTDQKLTYEELAEKSGVSSRYIKEIENHGNVPSIEKLGQLIRALHISADPFFYPDAPADNLDYKRLLVYLRHCSVQSDSGGQGSADSEYHRGHQEREYRVSE